MHGQINDDLFTYQLCEDDEKKHFTVKLSFQGWATSGWLLFQNKST